MSKKFFVSLLGTFGAILTISSCTLNVNDPVLNVNDNNSGSGSSVATPIMNPVGGSYSVDTNVIILCATSGATIHYTVDGSVPTSASAVYTSPIPVQGNGTEVTIKAIGVDGLNNSEVESQIYTINYNKVSTPAISPEAGTYNVEQSITITDSTPGATIHYTTNGSTPTASSTLYSGTFTISESKVVKAIAVKDQMEKSDVATSDYNLKVVTPVLSPAGASYSLDPHVTISTTTPDVDIYYTIDGSTPTVGSNLYSGAIEVSGQGTVENIKAIAVKDGWSNSNVASETYTINYDKVSTPSISPVAGTYNGSQNITITCLTEDVDIYYTTDGSTPSASSTHYVGAFASPSESTVVKAIAIKNEMQDSDVASNEYVLEVLTPTLSPASNSYSVDQHITISSDTPDAVIYYTTDGSTPTTDSSLYASPILVSGNGTNETIKAIAVKDGWNNSPVASESYSINYATVSTPSISPVAGTYNVNQSVTITDVTSGAEIHYTTNGSTPTGASALYTGAFTVSVNATVKAIATKSQMNDSGVASNAYVLQTVTPVMSPTGGTKTTDTSVSLSTTTSGATIYYTTDGSTPTTSSSVYSTPIVVAGQGTVETIKAIAVKSGWSNSAVASETYTINYPVVATPSISPASGPYGSAPFVSITTSTSGASIYYTLDGSTPTASSTLYTGSFQLIGSATVKAIAAKDQMQNSLVASNDYTLTVVTPVMSPASGSYVEEKYVSITTTTPSATIYYTFDGTTPTTSSSVYSTPILVTGNGTSQTIKAIAAKSGWTNSGTASETYILSYTVATPSISPATGIVASGTVVTLTTATAGAEIRYTTNGATPDGSSSLYNPSSKPTITSSLMFKAIAIKSGYTSSTVNSVQYLTPPLAAADKATFAGSGVTFKMAYVPGGLIFKAGAGDTNPTTVDVAYWIGETPVTYELWYVVKAWATSNGYTFSHDGKEGNDGVDGAAPTTAKQEPVTQINWRDTMIWMNALTEWFNTTNGTTYTCAYYTDAAYTTPIRTSTSSSTVTGYTLGTQDDPYIKTDATGFRMMTNYEYQLAARYKGTDSSNGAYEWPVGSGKWWTPGTYASGATANYNNATATELVSWYVGNSGNTTHDVKGKLPNALGLYDMSGNVWQFSGDWYSLDYGNRRAALGGSWYEVASYMQVYKESSYYLYLAGPNIGVRIVMPDSIVASAPVISPGTGAVINGTEVTLTTVATGVEIRYTTNGVDPDGSSSLYNPSSKPTITSAMTLKAISIKSGYANSAVSSASYTILSNDATLKATSTVKGQVLLGLGTPNATLGSAVAGTVTITAEKAVDTSNTGSFITLFDKNNANATVKVVKYANGASTTNFATDTAYANQAITNLDFFIIKVTAQDATTVLYYKVVVTVTPSTDATLKATSTVKGQVLLGLGTPNATLGSAVAGTVTITSGKAADTSNTGSFITLFDKNNANATVKVVKYANGASTTNFATDTAYANQAITNLDFFIIRVTAQDGTTVLYYKIVVTVQVIISIGDSYQGGKAAYLLVSGDPGYNSSVQHGLIVATSDQNTALRWYNGAEVKTNATATAIGTGLANTNTVISVQGATATSYAAGLARAYAGGSYNDWYLPSKDELNKIYLNRAAIGMTTGYYWSSSEINDCYDEGDTCVWAQSFINGSQFPEYKDQLYRVRAVRSF